jgi:hypothetical protein
MLFLRQWGHGGTYMFKSVEKLTQPYPYSTLTPNPNPNPKFHVNGQSDSSLKRIIPEHHVPSRGSQARGTRLLVDNILLRESGTARRLVALL